ncbi:MAG TPA: zinc ribbon domain-containing protein [Smithellaceae bacterium]|nr:zinc ribbon domain-containing protein [Smithellaceae bacterium]
MRDLMRYALIIVVCVICGYLIASFLNETISLAILIVFFILWIGFFLMFILEINQADALKTAQDSLVEKLNTSIGAQAESIRASLKQGTDYLSHVAREYDDRGQNYHSRHSAFIGLVKYHIYAAAIRQLHQTRNAEKAVKFVRKEMEVLEKIETEKDNYELCGGRAHAEEQALNTLLGRVNNGTLTPKTAFLRCKSCGEEFQACPRCSGELERRFK